VDEAARTGGQAVGNGKRGPEEIRHDIEQTREELGETVEALAAKTDVKAQAKAKAEDAKARARATVEAKLGAVKQRLGAAEGDPGAAQAIAGPGVRSIGAVPAAAPSDATHRLRAEPRIFAVVGAVAAGLLLVSLLRKR
jgi:hypothetical protein